MILQAHVSQEEVRLLPEPAKPSRFMQQHKTTLGTPGGGKQNNTRFRVGVKDFLWHSNKKTPQKRWIPQK